MGYSFRTHAILANAIGDELAATDLKSAMDTAIAGGVGTDPSVTTLTTTGDITSGGNVKLASGKVLKVNNIQVVGAQQSAPSNVTITFTANAPATYASPATTKTVADGSTPTVAELLDLVCDLRGVIANILTVLHTHGLTT
jgi:hypothetical protein